MKNRPRRLRRSPAIRNLVREITLSVNDLIMPMFIEEGSGKRTLIESMPGFFRLSLDEAVIEAKDLRSMGLQSILLFAKIAEDLKDNTGKEALNRQGLMQRSIRAIKDAVPDILIMTDVALDPFSSYGHDGIVEDGIILNDSTVEVLAEMALSHAEAGADFVAPSDMMDGRVGAIRAVLDHNGFVDTGIMAYSAKYASAYYGPFRDALDSAPGLGDKKTYQMDPANGAEGMTEALLDLAEGADIVMVKPAGPYLDVIRRVKDISDKPVAAYQVSGEYAMIKAASEKGWLDYDDIVAENLIAIKRAGADLIVTYFARDIHRILQW